MQLTKHQHFEEHCLFHDNLLLPEPDSHPPSPLPTRHSPGSQPHLEDPSGNDNTLRFYQEFKKIFTVSHHLHLEKQRQLHLWSSLHKRIKNLEQKLQGTLDTKTVLKESGEESKMKRARRTAEEIEKRFKCEVPFCERLYGSEGSLQQHIKLKHPQLYHKSQEEESMAAPQDLSL